LVKGKISGEILGGNALQYISRYPFEFTRREYFRKHLVKSILQGMRGGAKTRATMEEATYRELKIR
jgi:hypothetical protein